MVLKEHRPRCFRRCLKKSEKSCSRCILAMFFSFSKWNIYCSMVFMKGRAKHISIMAHASQSNLANPLLRLLNPSLSAWSWALLSACQVLSNSLITLQDFDKYCIYKDRAKDLAHRTPLTRVYIKDIYIFRWVQWNLGPVMFSSFSHMRWLRKEIHQCFTRKPFLLECRLHSDCHWFK